MNRGLTFYSIFLMMIATIVFTLGNYQNINATTTTPDLIDKIYNDISNNLTQSNGEDNLKTQDLLKECKHCNDKSKNNDNGDNKFGESLLSLPFNSHIADQSNNIKDYVSDIIPFP